MLHAAPRARAVPVLGPCWGRAGLVPRLVPVVGRPRATRAAGACAVPVLTVPCCAVLVLTVPCCAVLVLMVVPCCACAVPVLCPCWARAVPVLCPCRSRHPQAPSDAGCGCSVCAGCTSNPPAPNYLYFKFNYSCLVISHLQIQHHAKHTDNRSPIGMLGTTICMLGTSGCFDNIPPADVTCFTMT